MSYADLLRDPRWQRKRLEILEAADWGCEECGSGEDELHVHHLIYRRGLKPWEYAPDEYQVLCKHCHAKATQIRAELNELIAELRDDAVLVGMALALVNLRSQQPKRIKFSSDMALGVAIVFNLPVGVVRESTDREGWVKVSDLNALSAKISYRGPSGDAPSAPRGIRRRRTTSSSDDGAGR